MSDATDGREAPPASGGRSSDPVGREAPPASGDGPTPERRPDPADAAGRTVGRPAPQYGEYAPEGWVNPVEVERARGEREAAERRRAEADDQRRPVPVGRVGPPGRAPGRSRPAVPTSGRFGASPGDLLLTVLLLAFGFTTVVQQLFGISHTAATIADQIAARYTELAHPEALVPASALCAVVDLVLLIGTVWWSVARLRRRRVTFWVPLVGGAVAGAFSVVVYVVVLAHDPAYVTWMVTHSGL
ncbi:MULTISPECIES: DUF6264 family protein [unclassified Curtobacterium]|uniref:DUF6264 family protein n=1 Tax=unclassified Curtobacterium TaxID=257496 RepID=UPI000DA8167B|nr:MULTISPECIES: DUF6264 family protein [unclassified Curtobacterium]PZE75404.1 hypothetical protein DEI82_08730 [Curtobacterium sp. MCBD17_019]WIE53906.1 DUF6264 family protein [Curtobacterium sp. MCBD17_003]